MARCPVRRSLTTSHDPGCQPTRVVSCSAPSTSSPRPRALDPGLSTPGCRPRAADLDLGLPGSGSSADAPATSAIRRLWTGKWRPCRGRPSGSHSTARNRVSSGRLSSAGERWRRSGPDEVPNRARSARDCRRGGSAVRVVVRRRGQANSLGPGDRVMGARSPTHRRPARRRPPCSLPTAARALARHPPAHRPPAARPPIARPSPARGVRVARLRLSRRRAYHRRVTITSPSDHAAVGPTRRFTLPATRCPGSIHPLRKAP